MHRHKSFDGKKELPVLIEVQAVSVAEQKQLLVSKLNGGFAVCVYHDTHGLDIAVIELAFLSV